MLDLCARAPRGWRCTRKEGHDGPCAAEPDDMWRGARYAFIPALALWFVIIAGIVSCADRRDHALARQVECEHRVPPWLTAECKR